jgi:DNA polymerase I-like protein with 3'-5' exonuclease and polymerase domains
LANKRIREEGLDAEQIIFYHDEVAFDCHEDDKERLKVILLETMRESGEFYNLHIRLDAEVKFGTDWSIH